MSDYTPTTEEVREIFCTPMSTAEMIDPDAHYVKGEWFDRWHAAEIRRAKAEAWDEGYRQGIDDERTAEALRVGIGLGGYATANRSNPYREGDNEQL